MGEAYQFIDLGLKDYKETWDFQEGTLQSIQQHKKEGGEDAGSLIFVEHPHVYTLGKSGEQQNLLIPDALLKQINATFYRINRGGDITYHGPGQLVGYPVFNLDFFGMTARSYIHKLEQAIIDTLKYFGLNASRLEGATGVWLDVDNPTTVRKICAIGVRISRSVTMHGFALNVNTDLNYFNYINPCGFRDKGVTSMQKEVKKEVLMEDVKRVAREKFAQTFIH